MKALALFDFDGTISNRDSFLDFLLYANKKKKLATSLVKLMPTFVRYKLKLISKKRAKEKIISHFFSGQTSYLFEEKVKEYSKDRLHKLVKQSALERIKWHKSQHHTVVVVSGSLSHWLKDWCRKYSVDLIATELEIVNSKVTGKFSTKNCFGEEKVNRIIKKYDLNKFDYIYAYGNSRGDKEMLSIANERFYKNFK